MKSVFLVIFSFLLACSASAQSCLDDICFLTTTYDGDLSEKLSNGYSAFIVDASLQRKDLERISDYLHNNNDSRLALFLSSSKFLPYEQLTVVGLNEFLYDQSSLDTLLGVVINPKDRLFVFSDNESNYLATDLLVTNYDFGSKTISNPNNFLTKLILSDEKDQIEGKEAIKNLITAHGRLPNFLQTNQTEYFRPYLDSLDSVKWFKAIVLKEGQFLGNVLWKELPELMSTGKIHVNINRISPSKRGYRFSPDVSNYTPENEGIVKIFYANYQDINQGLLMNLDFDRNIVNRVRPEGKYLYGFVDYSEDVERGTYATFNGKSNYIDFGIPTNMDFQEITISAWIKPDTLNVNKSIIGIGNVFSAKVWKGKMIFTTPDIRDHLTDSVIIQTKKWQHVAYVYQANNEISFYHNGVLIESRPASDITFTTHSLLIGSNLWSQYFEGGIDDLYIWNRVLSDEEISKIYQQDLDKTPYRIEFYGIIALSFFVIVFGFYLWRKKTLLTPTHSDARSVRSVLANQPSEPGIYLFGGFKLINKDGKDLTNLFSPKRKEVFVLVLLYSFRKNGISSKQMSDILWEGHSFESAKNNRSTQMKRIREILSKNTGLSIEYDNKIWKIEIKPEVKWDFADYNYFKKQLLQKPLDEHILAHNVNGLLSVINQGVMLPNMHFEWLDPIKGQLSEEVIGILTPLVENDHLELENELRLKIANSIFSLDPLNERALKFKIKLLISEGNHMLAKNAFDQFCHAYFNFYDEVYGQEFSSFV
jgi:two-component SAPR family response regulator